MPKHSKNFLYNTLGAANARNVFVHLRLHLSTSTCRLCMFFLMFGTLYVDAVKGRKLLTGDGLVDVQELADAWRDCVRQVRENEAFY